MNVVPEGRKRFSEKDVLEPKDERGMAHVIPF